ncbi:MAG: F0F1 ATP synthase subunit B [Microbacteriaceae bacterium]
MLNAVQMAAEEVHNPLIPAPADLIWAGLCFLVILFFFWKVALPRMRAMLDARAEAIEGNIEKADQAQAKAEAALEEYTAQLAEARSEAAQIREQARADGKKILAELKEQATGEAARITAQAQNQIDAERQAAVVSLRAEVGSLALDLASGVIGASVSDDKNAVAIVDRFLADLEADEARKAGSNN